jgi:tRNA threonylcarbamoyladenosine biosynthesis protein TsaE
MKRFYHTESPTETKKIAGLLVKDMMGPNKREAACVLALEGDLGGGKTTFLQGLAKAMGIKDKILSPTFVIMKKFLIPEKKKFFFKNFYHLDCYRITKAEDIFVLGFSEIISDPENIVAIEWSEKIKSTLPEKVIKIKFGFISDEKRKIEIIK